MSQFQPNHQWYSEAAARALGQVPKGDPRKLVTGDQLADLLYGDILKPLISVELIRQWNDMTNTLARWSKP